MDFLSKLLQRKSVKSGGGSSPASCSITQTPSFKVSDHHEASINIAREVVEELVETVPRKSEKASSSQLDKKGKSDSSSNVDPLGSLPDLLQPEAVYKKQTDTDTDTTEYESAAETEPSDALSPTGSLLAEDLLNSFQEALEEQQKLPLNLTPVDKEIKTVQEPTLCEVEVNDSVHESKPGLSNADSVPTNIFLKQVCSLEGDPNNSFGISGLCDQISKLQLETPKKQSCGSVQLGIGESLERIQHVESEQISDASTNQNNFSLKNESIELEHGGDLLNITFELKTKDEQEILDPSSGKRKSDIEINSQADSVILAFEPNSNRFQEPTFLNQEISAGSELEDYRSVPSVERSVLGLIDASYINEKTLVIESDIVTELSTNVLGEVSPCSVNRKIDLLTDSDEKLIDKSVDTQTLVIESNKISVDSVSNATEILSVAKCISEEPTSLVFKTEIEEVLDGTDSVTENKFIEANEVLSKHTSDVSGTLIEGEIRNLCDNPVKPKFEGEEIQIPDSTPYSLVKSSSELATILQATSNVTTQVTNTEKCLVSECPLVEVSNSELSLDSSFVADRITLNDKTVVPDKCYTTGTLKTDHIEEIKDVVILHKQKNDISVSCSPTLLDKPENVPNSNTNYVDQDDDSVNSIGELPCLQGLDKLSEKLVDPENKSEESSVVLDSNLIQFKCSIEVSEENNTNLELDLVESGVDETIVIDSTVSVIVNEVSTKFDDGEIRPHSPGLADNRTLTVLKSNADVETSSPKDIKILTDLIEICNRQQKDLEQSKDIFNTNLSEQTLIGKEHIEVVGKVSKELTELRVSPLISYKEEIQPNSVLTSVPSECVKTVEESLSFEDTVAAEAQKIAEDFFNASQEIDIIDAESDSDTQPSAALTVGNMGDSQDLSSIEDTANPFVTQSSLRRSPPLPSIGKQSPRTPKSRGHSPAKMSSVSSSDIDTSVDAQKAKSKVTTVSSVNSMNYTETDDPFKPRTKLQNSPPRDISGDGIQSIQSKYQSSDSVEKIQASQKKSIESSPKTPPISMEVNRSEAGPEVADDAQFQSGDVYWCFLTHRSRLTDVFRDPATFDFLSTIGNSQTARDLRKESLYVKFDPLVGTMSRTDKAMPLPQQTDLNRTVSDVDSVLSHAVNTHNEETNVTPARNQALEYIDKLISLSPSPIKPLRLARHSLDKSAIRSPSKEHETGGKEDSVNDSNVSQDSNRSKEWNGNPEPGFEQAAMLEELQVLRELLSEQEKSYNDQIKTLQSKICSLEVSLKESEEKVQRLTRRMAEKSQGQQQMSIIMEEYEKTISRLVAEKEHERQSYEVEKENLIKEKDTVSGHLVNIEIAFSDVHKKYERSKSVIQGFKNNEEALRASLAEYEATIKKQEQKYETLKSHAMSQLESANQELDSMRRSQQAENSKLKAMLRKAEIKVNSLEETLEQKVKENQELVGICDELIGKVGTSD